MWWWSTVLLPVERKNRRWKGRIAEEKAANSNGWAWTIFMPTVLTTVYSVYSSSSSRFSSPPRLLPIPSSFHESCTRSPRAYSSLRVQMRRQIWFQVARPGYEPSLSARISINLTENQLRNNFIDRPSKSPVNEPRLKANPRSSASYNRRRHPFLPNRNRIECIESVENS